MSVSTYLEKLSPEKLGQLFDKISARQHGQSAREIPKRTDKGPCALSFAQERLWLVAQLEPDDPAYNIPQAVRLRGTLNFSALSRALNELVRRHEILRTTFIVHDDLPVQNIALPKPVPLPVVDLKRLPRMHAEQELLRRAYLDARRCFDLSSGPLLRPILFECSDDDHLLTFTMHHIIGDAWSTQIIIRELSTLYLSYAQGSAARLAEPALQYADFASWQRSFVQGEVLKSQLDYWKTKLGGDIAVIDLSIKPRTTKRTFDAACVRKSLSGEVVERLRSVAQQESASLFMAVLALFQVLLFRYSGSEDVPVGCAIANRNRRQLESVIGLFVNMVVLRLSLSGKPTFRELLRRVRTLCLEAYANQDLPFEKVVEELRPVRDARQRPLFQVTFIFDERNSGHSSRSDLALQLTEIDNGAAQYELAFAATDTGSGLMCNLQYQTALFDAQWAAVFLQHFDALAHVIAAEPDRPVTEIDLLNVEEREYLLTECNRTQVRYTQKRVHELFEEQAKRTPTAAAVEFSGSQLTYRELDQRANQLGRHLRKLSVVPETLVGIFLDPGLDMVIAVLGVLKAGAAYIPLDPESPPQRLHYMMENARVRLLLTQKCHLPKLSNCNSDAIFLDADWETIARQATEPLMVQTEPENVAYAIYTSGSSGWPKAVAVTQRGFSNYVNWALKAYNLTEEWTAPLHSSLSFDLTVTSLYPVLLTGGRVIILPKAGDVESLARCIDTLSGKNLLKLTPSHMRILHGLVDFNQAKEGASWTLVIGGEALHDVPFKLWRQRHPTRFINEYGPTETVVGSAFYQIDESNDDESSTVPIGRPIANTQLYVLDAHLNLVAATVPGELYIGGDGLARGYLGHAEWSAERFVPNPFSKGGGERLYRTGDRVRWSMNGNLEYLGRIDEQVKILGLRIEPGEVESALRRHPCVRQAAVICVPDSTGTARLLAYVVAEPSPSASELRSFLLGYLPVYMVPAHIVFLSELPLALSGKLDRNKLPEPDAIQDPGLEPAVSSHSSVQESIAAIWREFLGLRHVGINQNFFELGGHSLLASKVISRIRTMFGRQIPLREFFDHPTIASLAELLVQIRVSDGTCSNTDVLVPIQSQGEKPPLFCVHPIGGGVSCYLPLSRRLGADQPVYGLQAPELLDVMSYEGSQDLAEPYISMEEMAAHYVNAVRQVQSCGPYMLAGWSYGGVVALEMANQLLGLGERVSLLAFFDALPPSPGPELPESMLLFALGKELAAQAQRPWDLSLETLQGLEMNNQLPAVLEKMKALRLLPLHYGVEHVRRFINRFRVRERHLQYYIPKSYTGKAILFRAMQTDEEIARAANGDDAELLMAMSRIDYGWGDICVNGVDVYRVDGIHATILHEKNVSGLAGRLSNVIQSVLLDVTSHV